MIVTDSVGNGHIEIVPVDLIEKGSIALATVRSGIPAFTICKVETGEYAGKLGICSLHSVIRIGGKWILPKQFLLQIIELEDGEQVIETEFMKEKQEEFRGILS